MRTLALERFLAHVARAGEAMGRPGAIPRSDGHITMRGEVLGPARPSLRLFSKGARETKSEQSHAACMSDAQTAFASLPNAQTACPRLSGVPSRKPPPRLPCSVRRSQTLRERELSRFVRRLPDELA